MASSEPYHPRADPNETDEAREERLRAEGDVAFQEDRFDEALNRRQQAGVDEAIRWFREYGVTFSKLRPKITPLEMIIGLAQAARAEVEERGENVPDKLQAAAGYLFALAELRIAIDKAVGPTKAATGMRMAELAARSVVLGEMTGFVKAVRLGWIDKMSTYDAQQERRRVGAAKVNMAKATVKQSALSEAMRITSKNPTLSAEDLAIKIRDSLVLPTTIKTLSDWVREWRRQKFLDPQKAT